MNGKSKCKILKQIRQQIADENDIAYVTSECKYQGDCSGTCPKCEAEVFFLEQELEKRRKTGKKVVLAGIAAATVVGLAWYAADNAEQEPQIHSGAPPYPETSSSSTEENTGKETKPSDNIVLDGDVAYIPDDDEELGGAPIWDDDEVMGELPVEDPFYDKEPGIDDGDWGALH